MRNISKIFIGISIVLFSCSDAQEQVVDKQPNIILIMADDMGYSDIGCYGGEIETPNLDALAENGVRFSQFYNAARCCPTRAALLTGLYPHQAGVGKMISHSERKAFSPYQGYLASHSVTMAEVLKSSGYDTYMSGKWHVGEFRPHWPVDRGFDQHYGLISGAMNYFNIEKGKNKNVNREFAINDSLIVPQEENFYATDAFTDKAVEMLKTHQGKSNPFFLYLAYNAPHWPLHAHEKDIRKYLGKYMKGWDHLRKTRYESLLETGIINERNTELSPSHPEAADWDSLSEEKKQEMDRKMAVYAAQVECLDRNIGRLIDYLKGTGEFDNTVIMFLSDNGASHEQGALGKNFRKDLTGEIGTEDSYHSYGLSWANASNTPFRLFKVFNHEGGIATPFIVHWPRGIKEKGSINHQVAHVMDLLPTFIDLTGANYPDTVNGIPILPLQGMSLLSFLEGNELVERTLYWEHENNRALRKGNWKLVKSRDKDNWELYDMSTDRTELNNLFETHRKKADSLLMMYRKWAEDIGVSGY